VGVNGTGLDVEDAQGQRRRIESVCKVWAAGVQASPLGALIARQSGAELDRAGRVRVRPDLTLPGHPEVFVLGDMIALDDLPDRAGVLTPATALGEALIARLRARDFTVSCRRVGWPSAR